jgi:arabinan endo-1,5-alpha-L-arabinosidase
MVRVKGLLLLAVVFAVHCASAGAYPEPGRVVGGTLIHDPSMIVRNLNNPACTCTGAPRYVVYGTSGITLVSNDRITFAYGGLAFPAKPDWWAKGGYTDGPWGPDVSFHNGKYWLYYAVTGGTGSRRSAIGVATSSTGLPGTWTDHGQAILTSTSADDFNAIGANLLVDAQGKWWLTYGSFWSGIWQVSLDPSTGLPNGAPTHLAERPRAAGAAGPGIEGAFIYQRGGFYYLFASFDRCCQGNASTYNVRVGRSTSPTGPYADAAGTPMLQGGGTDVLSGHGDVVGPGGLSVVHDNYFGSHDLLVYHYYDRRINTVTSAAIKSTGSLGINFLDFSSGWPVVY